MSGHLARGEAWHGAILDLLEGHQPPENAGGSYADGFLDAVKKIRNMDLARFSPSDEVLDVRASGVGRHDCIDCEGEGTVYDDATYETISAACQCVEPDHE